MPPKKRLIVKTTVKKKTTAKKAKSAEFDSDDCDAEDYNYSPSHSTTREKTPPASPREPTPPPSPPAAKSKKKSKPQTRLLISEEDEVALGEWLRQNDCIFRKTEKKYHNAPHKKGLWDDKAAELDLESGQVLQTWYNSIRTRIGKLHKTASGSAAKDRSARDSFLWANFSFLADHIHRMKGQTAVTVSIKYLKFKNYDNIYYTTLLLYVIAPKN